MAKAVRIKVLGNGGGFALDLGQLVFPTKRQAEVVKKAVDHSLEEAEKLERAAVKVVQSTADFLGISPSEAAKRLGISWEAVNKQEERPPAKLADPGERSSGRSRQTSKDKDKPEQKSKDKVNS